MTTYWRVCLSKNKRAFISTDHASTDADYVSDVGDYSREEAMHHAVELQKHVNKSHNLTWSKDAKTLVERATEARIKAKHVIPSAGEQAKKKHDVVMSDSKQYCTRCDAESTLMVTRLQVAGIVAFEDEPHCDRCVDLYKRAIIQMTREQKLREEGGIQTTMQFTD